MPLPPPPPPPTCRCYEMTTLWDWVPRASKAILYP